MRYLAILIIIIGVYACSGSSNKSISNSIKSDTLKNGYATGFRIIKHENSTTLEVINPWQQAKNVKIKYSLVHDELKNNSKNSDINIIKVPLKRVVCLSTTHLAFIDAIQSINSVVAISGAKLVSNPVILHKLAQKQVYEIGYEQSLNYELLLSLKPDAIFIYGVGAEVSTYLNKLKELNIPVILIGEYLETNALAKTEWLKFFGEFYDKRELANHLFDSIALDYNQLKKMALKTTNKPKVISSMPFNGIWYISGSKSYAAKLINDAGGDFAWKSVDSKESVPMDMESVFQMAKGADIWLNNGSVNSKKEILSIDARLANLQPYKTGKMFNFNARVTSNGGNDYWESGAVYANIVLKDLISILHPEMLPNYKLYYYQKLE